MVEEKVYTIPLREAYKKNRIDRANYAIRLVEDYLKKHTKREKVKLGKHLNSSIWARGPKKPPTKVKVKALIDKDVVKAEILGKEYEEFVAMKVKKKEKFLEKLKERIGAKAEKHEEEEKLIEGKKGETAKEEEKPEVAKEEAKEEKKDITKKE